MDGFDSNSHLQYIKAMTFINHHLTSRRENHEREMIINTRTRKGPLMKPLFFFLIQPFFTYPKVTKLKNEKNILKHTLIIIEKSLNLFLKSVIV